MDEYTRDRWYIYCIHHAQLVQQPIKLEFTLCRCLTEAREIWITWRNKDSSEQAKKENFGVNFKGFLFSLLLAICYAPTVSLTRPLYKVSWTEESKKNSSWPDKHTDWENGVTEQIKATVPVNLQLQGLIYYPNMVPSFRPDGKILTDSLLSESFSSLCLPKLLTFSFS